MIDLTIHPEQLDRAIQRAREKNIIIPTFKQQLNPQLIPTAIVDQLKGVGLWDIDPLNLISNHLAQRTGPIGGALAL